MLLAFIAWSGARSAEDMAVEAERQGAAVWVTARATLQAPRELVWDILTDYNGLGKFVPGLRQSRVIEREGLSAVVEQSGEAHLLFFSFPIEVTVRSIERPPYVIEARLLKGNLKQFSGSYHIEPLAENRLALRWSGVIEPGVALPPLIGHYLIRASVEDQFYGMVREIERRAREPKGVK